MKNRPSNEWHEGVEQDEGGLTPVVNRSRTGCLSNNHPSLRFGMAKLEVGEFYALYC